VRTAASVKVGLMSRPFSKQPRDLAGLKIAITGGARGIGEATAERLTKAGADVIIGDRDLEVARSTAERIGCRAAPLDVTSVESWEAFAAQAGALDVLINNAGIMPIGPILEEPAAVAHAVFAVNVHGTINGVKTVGPAMVSQGSGHIVNISSAVGRIPARGGATYSASKHAIVGFTDAVRQELAPHGVIVSMVLPSIIRTELAAGVPDTPGVPPQTADDVAVVIEDVLRKPVPEAWVPRWIQPMSRLTGVLPRGIQAKMMERAKGNVLDEVDPTARAAYEERARG
jgi:NAD(P)-dependent dehydrogenase (short-subunit alcohol dehydrogenase family)